MIKPGCLICEFTYRLKYLNINDFILPVLARTNCDSLNAIYVLKCDYCKNTFYIGQTKTVKTRIRQHILDIKNFKPYTKMTSVSAHFNLKNHNYLDHFKFFIIEDNIDDLDFRLKKEATLINLFLKFDAQLINDFIPNLYNCF